MRRHDFRGKVDGDGAVIGNRVGGEGKKRFDEYKSVT